MLSTYAQLQSRLAEWIDSPAVEPQIPTFIALAEAQVERSLRVRRMLKRSRTNAEAQFTALPADFLEIASVRLVGSDITKLPYLSPDSVAELKPIIKLGKPRFYSLVADGLELIPAPSEEQTVELNYYAKLERLSDSVSTNWLLEEHPDVYLYGSLVQAAPYVEQDARTSTWGALYRAALEDVRKADEREGRSSGAIRMNIRSFG